MVDRLIKDLPSHTLSAGDAFETDDGVTAGGNRWEPSAAVASLLNSADAAGLLAALGLSDSPTFNFADTLAILGYGADGAVTISSGTTTLNRDTYYTTLTLSGTGQLITNGFRVFCSVALDLSAAPSNAIIARLATTGIGSTGSTAGTGGVAGGSVSAGTVAGGSTGSTGGAGGTAAGSNGVAATAVTIFQNSAINGGAGGAGGLGSGGAGGIGGTPATSNTHQERTLSITTLRGSTLAGGGASGTGGGGGGGDGTAGAGGGGSGTSPGDMLICARTIIRGTNTNTGIITCVGRVGGAGGSATAGNRGGGGGGGGSTGGYIRIIYITRTGSTITNAIDVSGGNGGVGGNGFGTGVGGNGGGAGSGGYVDLWDLGAGTHTAFQGSAPVVGSAASGVTGGAGATAAVSRTNL